MKSNSNIINIRPTQMLRLFPSRFSFQIRLAEAITALLLGALSPLTAQTRPWWDNYPIIVGSNDLATVQANNGTCGFGNGDPSWCMYAQKEIGDWHPPVTLHNAGCKYITYYETFGTSTSFILELGPTKPEGDSSVYRFYWSWNMVDTKGGAFRWAGPQNYFDAESFCGPYTRLHPVYGASGRAMTYPDGTPATGYFGNDNTDPRKSRVLDACSSKDILGNVENWLGYVDGVAGNPLRSGGLLPVTVSGSTHLAGYLSTAKDAACPMWIDQQRSSILYSVAMGQIDGIWTDNFSPWDNFGYPPVKVAFGDWSVARFRTYLRANFTTAQLTAMGVSHVKTFDVRTALRSKLTALGGTYTNLDDSKWNDASWLDDSIWRAYKIFKRQVGTEALTNYYNVSKDAAAHMGVSDFAVLGNDIPVFSLGYCRGTLDMVSTEVTPGWSMGTSARGFMIPPVGRFAPMYKLGREHAKSRLLNTWMYFNNGYEPYKENPGAVNTVYYEMLANHAMPMLLPGNAGTTQSATINGGFTNFVKATRATFGGRDSLADVGIYYSTSSVIAYMTPAGFYDMNNQPHAGAYNGWGTALGNLHYQYRPIPEWKLTADTLAKLRVLVIPNADVLDSVDVSNIITPWVTAGGRLIVTGSSGARKGESGNFDLYANFSLSALTGVTILCSGAPATQLTTIGFGKVYYIKNNIGLAYFNASTATDRANLISGFSTAMNQVLGKAQTLLYPVTPIPDTVGINLYEDPAALRFFIDVNNYDVNLATDIVTATPATIFTVKAPAWLASASLANIRVQVLSPTTPAPAVKITKSGADRIQVQLGAVTNYASIVVTTVQSLTWNGGGGNPSDNAGIWDATIANWWATSAAVWTDSNNAVFGIGTGSDTPYTVTLGRGFNPTVGNLTFANQSYTLTGGAINFGATSVIQVDAGRSAMISSLITGATGLVKNGAGTLTINNKAATGNEISGAFVVNGGTVVVTDSSGANQNIGLALKNIKSITINGATMSLQGTQNALSLNLGPITIQNGGVLSADCVVGNNHSLGALTLNGGTLAVGGTVQASYGNFSLNGDVTVGGTALSVISAPVTMLGGIRTFNVADSVAGVGTDLLVSGIINNGGITKNGAGTMELTATNPYGGATTVSGGILILGGTIANTSSVSIAAGAQVSVSGKLYAAGSIVNSGTLVFTGSAQFGATGTITNNGVIINSSTSLTLPTIVNNGTIYNVRVAPTGIVATPGNAQVGLTWSPVFGATSYKVRRSTVSGGPYSVIGTPTTASFNSTGLTNEALYYYVISAATPAGESVNSAQVCATPGTAKP